MTIVCVTDCINQSEFFYPPCLHILSHVSLQTLEAEYIWSQPWLWSSYMSSFGQKDFRKRNTSKGVKWASLSGPALCPCAISMGRLCFGYDQCTGPRRMSDTWARAPPNEPAVDQLTFSPSADAWKIIGYCFKHWVIYEFGSDLFCTMFNWYTSLLWKMYILQTTKKEKHLLICEGSNLLFTKSVFFSYSHSSLVLCFKRCGWRSQLGEAPVFATHKFLDLGKIWTSLNLVS